MPFRQQDPSEKAPEVFSERGTQKPLPATSHRPNSPHSTKGNNTRQAEQAALGQGSVLPEEGAAGRECPLLLLLFLMGRWKVTACLQRSPPLPAFSRKCFSKTHSTCVREVHPAEKRPTARTRSPRSAGAHGPWHPSASQDGWGCTVPMGTVGPTSL